MDHLFPASGPQENVHHGVKCNVIDANRSASTAGKKVGGNQTSNIGDQNSTFSGMLNKAFGGSWFPQVEKDDDDDDVKKAESDDCCYKKAIVRVPNYCCPAEFDK
eukprot:CAMPEP_0170466766 /NCGR_PEP_ID=MMETSP0123-20130129/10593_1 /TAXON_ID=182087 /ORGANISM="Favella ehrenbergii, Strain Fehren 1" /LENGTH=104 /DNA_ID=CAMNT_0010732957 /DNA_START=200 /DNA_END=514 /DNA_ORIENTATION=+